MLSSLFAPASLNAAEPLEVVLEVALHLLVLDGGQGGVGGPEVGVQTPPSSLNLLTGGDAAPAPSDPPGLLGGRGEASEGSQNWFITSGGQRRGRPDKAGGFTLLGLGGSPHSRH